MTLKRQLTAIAFLTALVRLQLYSASYPIPYQDSQHTLEQLYNTKMDFETLAKSTKIPPSLTTSSSVGPVPTVIPGPGASLQEVHTTGKRTLWYVIFHQDGIL